MNYIKAPSCIWNAIKWNRTCPYILSPPSALALKWTDWDFGFSTNNFHFSFVIIILQKKLVFLWDSSNKIHSVVSFFPSLSFPSLPWWLPTPNSLLSVLTAHAFHTPTSMTLVLIPWSPIWLHSPHIVLTTLYLHKLKHWEMGFAKESEHGMFLTTFHSQWLGETFNETRNRLPAFLFFLTIFNEKGASNKHRVV